MRRKFAKSWEGNLQNHERNFRKNQVNEIFLKIFSYSLQFSQYSPTIFIFKILQNYLSKIDSQFRWKFFMINNFSKLKTRNASKWKKKTKQCILWFITFQTSAWHCISDRSRDTAGFVTRVMPTPHMSSFEW